MFMQYLIVQEWARHKKRYEMFTVKVDDELKTEVEGVIRSSRVTLTEHLLLQGVETATQDMQAAKNVVNEQIKAWSLPSVAIECTDIQPKLWSLAQSITQGKLLTT